MFVCRNEMGKTEVAKTTTFDYALIVDAGAKGTTLYIYNVQADGKVGVTKGRTVEPPLTTLVDSPQKAAQYLKPLFDHAHTVIPDSASTVVFIRASTDMRSVSPRQQQRIFHAIYRGFRRRISAQFKLKRRNIKTLSAAEQGYFHMLATNMLYNKIPATLDTLQAPPLGTINIGAASTQIWLPQLADGVYPREGSLKMSEIYIHK
jgi:Golgi nucleoside diphosphatase